MAKCANCDYPYATGEKCPNCGSTNPGGCVPTIRILLFFGILYLIAKACS